MNKNFSKAEKSLIESDSKLGKVIENNGEITSPSTTNPPDINKTISNKYKFKGLNSFHSIFRKVTTVNNVFIKKIEPINMLKRGINLIAIIFKAIFLEKAFVINELSSKSNFLLKT